VQVFVCNRLVTEPFDFFLEVQHPPFKIADHRIVGWAMRRRASNLLFKYSLTPLKIENVIWLPHVLNPYGWLFKERAGATGAGDPALTVPKTSAHLPHQRNRSSSSNLLLQHPNRKPQNCRKVFDVDQTALLSNFSNLREWIPGTWNFVTPFQVCRVTWRNGSQLFNPAKEWLQRLSPPSGDISILSTVAEGVDELWRRWPLVHIQPPSARPLETPRGERRVARLIVPAVYATNNEGKKAFILTSLFTNSALAGITVSISKLHPHLVHDQRLRTCRSSS